MTDCCALLYLYLVSSTRLDRCTSPTCSEKTRCRSTTVSLSWTNTWTRSVTKVTGRDRRGQRRAPSRGNYFPVQNKGFGSSGGYAICRSPVSEQSSTAGFLPPSCSLAPSSIPAIDTHDPKPDRPDDDNDADADADADAYPRYFFRLGRSEIARSGRWKARAGGRTRIAPGSALPFARTSRPPSTAQTPPSTFLACPCTRTVREML